MNIQPEEIQGQTPNTAAGITESLLVDGKPQIDTSCSQEVTLWPHVVTGAVWERW